MKIKFSPPFPAMFSFMMLGSTPKGDAYTEREFRANGPDGWVPRGVVRNTTAHATDCGDVRVIGRLVR